MCQYMSVWLLNDDLAGMTTVPSNQNTVLPKDLSACTVRLLRQYSCHNSNTVSICYYVDKNIKRTLWNGWKWYLLYNKSYNGIISVYECKLNSQSLICDVQWCVVSVWMSKQDAEIRLFFLFLTRWMGKVKCPHRLLSKSICLKGGWVENGLCHCYPENCLNLVQAVISFQYCYLFISFYSSTNDIYI